MSRDVDETIEYRGHKIEIGYEEEYGEEFDPREYDNMGTMNVAIRNHTYGDEQTDPEDMRVECRTCAGHGSVPVPVVGREQSNYSDSGIEDCPTCDTSGEVSDPIRWAVEVEGATVVLPIYAYIHSGTTFRTSTRLYPPTESKGGNPFTCQWDSGMAGIIYDTPDGLNNNFGVYDSEAKRYTGKYLTQDGNAPSAERIEEILRGEVEVYDDYLTGQIKWYRVEGEVCDDSCGGFFPDHGKSYAEEWDYMVNEAKGAIDSSIAWSWQKGIEEAQEQQKIASMMAL